MNSNVDPSMPQTVAECFDAIVHELPYWMKEVHGKQMVKRVETFIKENEKQKNQFVARSH